MTGWHYIAIDLDGWDDWLSAQVETLAPWFAVWC